MIENKQEDPFRIGLIATDPLRVLGLSRPSSQKGVR